MIEKFKDSIDILFLGAISRYSFQSFIFLKKKNKRIFTTIGARIPVNFIFLETVYFFKPFFQVLSLHLPIPEHFL
jgi:hypothetical protein